MSTKLDQIGEERGGALHRRDEWDVCCRRLDKRYRRQENTEIHDLIHAFNLVPEQLGQLLCQTAQSPLSPEVVNQMVKKDVAGED